MKNKRYRLLWLLMGASAALALGGCVGTIYPENGDNPTEQFLIRALELSGTTRDDRTVHIGCNETTAGIKACHIWRIGDEAIHDRSGIQVREQSDPASNNRGGAYAVRQSEARRKHKRLNVR